ncbi:fimbria/pilus periplasmic chaperone [Ramlibacter solisilvae]|uniref:Pili assembly chaperone N-terminal domain-containing protein n=1 Tax=Ramlibacter tataouinensis TaxID=94132 RepID=A0A127JSC7_9BURK|nr:fimbria/pilus periplasmic chaperone [Ramlibacter tataouinensis]AMO22881.1 hypothetical protein UC35_08235 [Ramlibacter tataouinensis]
MNPILRAALLALCVATAAPVALAAEFTVTPVRIFMTPRDRAVAVTITNDSSDEIVMQAELYSWKQSPDGVDQLELTDDVVLSPPILKVPGKSRQVVRLARLTPPPAGQEQTYRLIVREVPEAKPQDKLSVQLALAFSLPVFITPPGAKRSLACEIQRSAPDAVLATCENAGRAYAQVRTFELQGGNSEKLAARENGGYILPGVKRSFELKRAAGKIPGGAVTLQVALDDGTTQSFEGKLLE